jgi:hypothetical protein
MNKILNIKLWISLTLLELNWDKVKSEASSFVLIFILVGSSFEGCNKSQHNFNFSSAAFSFAFEPTISKSLWHDNDLAHASRICGLLVLEAMAIILVY